MYVYISTNNICMIYIIFCTHVLGGRGPHFESPNHWGLPNPNPKASPPERPEGSGLGEQKQARGTTKSSFFLGGGFQGFGACTRLFLANLKGAFPRSTQQAPKTSSNWARPFLRDCPNGRKRRVPVFLVYIFLFLHGLCRAGAPAESLPPVVSQT